MGNKTKRKITITLNNDVIKKTEKLTTNKSRLVENILLQYLLDYYLHKCQFFL